MHYLDYTDTSNRVIPTVLRVQAEHNGTTIFLAADEARFSYAQTLERVERFAAGLQGQGVQAGDNVCLYLSSCADYIFLSLAANLVGARWIPVNTDYRGVWLKDTILDSQPKLIVTDSTYLPELERSVATDCPVIVLDVDQSMLDVDGVPSDLQQAIAYGDTCAIMWTSGTTGRAKGVMQSHNTWVRAALSAAQLGDVGKGDVLYNCLPLYNSAAWVANIYPALLSGTTVAIDPVFSASTFWDRTRFYGATHVFTLGAMHMFLWNAPASEDDRNNPIRSANMVPMPDAIHRPFQDRFGIDAIHQGFGQSEVMHLCRRKDDGVTQYPPGAVGHPADDLELALLDDANNPVNVGEVGEFCVRERGPHVLFNGYFNDEEATRSAYVDGWYHTGDLGKQDEDGHYFFVDRKKDVIRYKGRNVSSVAVESVARQHPAVQDVAVFGIVSEELDAEHEIMLAAVLKPDAKAAEADLARFINENAPYFFVPRYIEWLESLPMTPTQKVRKIELRERGLTDATWDAKSAGFEVRR